MVPNSVIKFGVCAIMSMWLVYIKDHLWTIGFAPNHRASNSSKNKAEAGDDGEWLNKVSVPYEAAPLYAPQGVEMGGGGSPSKTG